MMSRPKTVSWAIDFREIHLEPWSQAQFQKVINRLTRKKRRSFRFSETHCLGGRGRLIVYFRIDLSFLFFSFSGSKPVICVGC